MSDGITAPPWVENWAMQWVVLLVLFGVLWLLWQAAPTPPLAPHPLLTDLYGTLGDSLRHGLGFVLPPQHPYAAAAEQTSPLYPLLAAGVMSLIGHGWQGADATEALEALGWVQFGLACSAVLMVFLFCRVRINTAHALLLAIWVTLLPAVWGSIHGLSPQLLYLGCSLLALLVIDKYFASKGDEIKPIQVLHCSLWVTASVLANVPQGLLLMCAYVVLAFAKLGFKRGLNATLGMLLVLSPWVLWSVSRHPDMIQQSITQLEAALWPARGSKGMPIAFSHLGASLDWLFAHALHGLWGDASLQALPLIGNDLPDAGWAWAAIGPLRWLGAGLLLLGILAGFSQFSGVASGYMLLTMFAALAGFQLDLLASTALAPLTAFYLLVGIRWLIRGLKDVQLAPIGTAAIVAASTLVGINCLTVVGQTMNQPYQPQPAEDWRHATDWLATHTTTRDTVATTQPTLVRLFAQRPALLSLHHRDANLRAAERKLITYPITEGTDGSESESVPRDATLAYSHNQLSIWQTTPPSKKSSPDKVNPAPAPPVAPSKPTAIQPSPSPVVNQPAVSPTPKAAQPVPTVAATLSLPPMPTSPPVASKGPIPAQ